MTRRLVVAGCAASLLLAGAVSASAGTDTPTKSPQELCVVVGGNSNQAFCINWTGSNGTH